MAIIRPDAGEAGSDAAQANDQTPAQLPETLPDDYKISWETSKGDKYEATIAELRDGHLRQQDYTRKTEDLARQRKEHDALVERLKPYQDFEARLQADPVFAQNLQRAIQQAQSGGVSSQETDDYMEPDAQVKRYDQEIANLRQEMELRVKQIEGEGQIKDALERTKAWAKEQELPWDDEISSQLREDLRALPLSGADGLPNLTALYLARNLDKFTEAQHKKAIAEYTGSKSQEMSAQPIGAGTGAVRSPKKARAEQSLDEIKDQAVDFINKAIGQ